MGKSWDLCHRYILLGEGLKIDINLAQIPNQRMQKGKINFTNSLTPLRKQKYSPLTHPNTFWRCKIKIFDAN